MADGYVPRPGEEQKESVKRMWLAGGKSFSTIASELHLTIGQVSGIVNRAGLNNSPDRPLSRKPSRPQERAIALTPAGAACSPSRKRKPLIETPEPRHEALEPMPVGAVTVENLSADICRWPIGDPQQKDFRFCGRKAGHLRKSGRKSPYCEGHDRMAGDLRSREQRVKDAIEAKGADAVAVFPY
ncbi:MAG: hypothetical protein KBC38_02230 [Candidatus Pacebacteria bacterium]|nr:hypothetical protein [Candidatus Paceibacterota bacterium]MBP9840658.1 hypothetical protein [Candidatus Paceibacterota bacterium]